ncbi:uncharacterized protein [Acropora muricata]|uniref:uncharacterized protein n=1 Tax=Acropora muricata TaxID=159855 RepID=UPI0034E42247
MVEKGEYRLDVMWEIDFDALENPTWRSQEGLSCDQGDVKKTVKEMISDIMTFHKRWEEEENNYDQKMVEEVKDKFFLEFITHVNKEEEHGVSTIEETTGVLRHGLIHSQPIQEQETMNLEKAYDYLLSTIEKEEKRSDYGLLEVSLLQETHRIILKDLPLPTKGSSEPGKLSNLRRITEFKGEIYEYPCPEDMTNAVNKILDKYNSLFDRCTKQRLDEYDNYYNLFKLCAWLLFELLDLHPFSDGNGRLCRILGSYLLSFFSPFPTPIYNVWTQSNKDDYKQALVDARKSKTRHPCALASMIIECNYHGWKNFFGELDERRNVENGTQEKSLNSTAGEN